MWEKVSLSEFFNIKAGWNLDISLIDEEISGWIYICIEIVQIKSHGEGQLDYWINFEFGELNWEGIIAERVGKPKDDVIWKKHNKNAIIIRKIIQTRERPHS